MERSEQLTRDNVDPTKRWFRNEYLRIVSASYDARYDALTVHFLDGDTATLTASRLLRPGEHDVRWDQLEVVDNYHLHVPAEPQSLDIPGFTIRALTDAEFAAHLARSAEDAARHIGARLRMLRKARGLTAKEVAARAGLAQQTITRIELGQHDVTYTTLEKVLAAMGYGLGDLVEIA